MGRQGTQRCTCAQTIRTRAGQAQGARGCVRARVEAGTAEEVHKRVLFAFEKQCSSSSKGRNKTKTSWTD
eukprot:315235-Pelagomonas_calceolata.AAC.5